MWGLAAWDGAFYRRGTRAEERLAQYASVFDAVEGNTTFYAVPSAASVERWRRATPGTFRFCFKFPSALTHEAALSVERADVEEFLERLAPLGERVGPFLLQLPASFPPSFLGRIERFAGMLPAATRCAVELRHPGFHAGEALERVDALLAERGWEWALLDRGGLDAGDLRHPEVRAAEHAKPRLPLHLDRARGEPFVRAVFHPQRGVNEEWLDRWAERVAGWLADGRRPWFFAHCPNNFHSPWLAREVHRRVVARGGEVGELARFPAEERRGVDRGGQLRLWKG